MKDDLTEYLSSKKLEEHISHIILIIERHSKKKPNLVRTGTKPIKGRGAKEILFENQFFVIAKDYHTKDKIDIWVLKLKRKIWLEKDEFSELKEFIECYDGYYSGFSGGFIFPSMPTTKITEEVTELLLSLV
jgi:hypothetical protein